MSAECSLAAETNDRAPITARDVLQYATIEGARANGLDAKVGSLTPGKQADIIMLRTNRMNVTPLNDPATAGVTSMDTGNVDTVHRLASDSRDFVLAKSGVKPPKI